MRFPTMCYVRPAKAQTSLRIRAVWSELLLVAWILHDSQVTDRTPFAASKLKGRLHRLIWVYTCQNTTLLESTCRGSIMYITLSIMFWCLSHWRKNMFQMPVLAVQGDSRSKIESESSSTSILCAYDCICAGMSEPLLFNNLTMRSWSTNISYAG